jgi:hypothetical protein
MGIGEVHRTIERYMQYTNTNMGYLGTYKNLSNKDRTIKYSSKYGAFGSIIQML